MLGTHASLGTHQKRGTGDYAIRGELEILKTSGAYLVFPAQLEILKNSTPRAAFKGEGFGLAKFLSLGPAKGSGTGDLYESSISDSHIGSPNVYSLSPRGLGSHACSNTPTVTATLSEP
jgi:hypothetical protein